MKITVMGSGRWASFNAWYQSEILKNETLVWGRAGDGTYEPLVATRKNEYLELNDTVHFTEDLGYALDFSDYIIISISAQAMADFSARIGELQPKGKTFILCMKGISDETGERLSEILQKHIDPSNKIVVWVGPGHAEELVRGLPQVMIIDGTDKESVKDVIGKFKSDLIRFYEGDDLVGVEVGAAAKNVLGIMAGLLDGANMSSLKGPLMARGAYEVAKLIVAMGGKQMTAYGISHFGDYEATLFSKNSRNRRYGEMLYKGEHSEYPAEGVATSKALEILSKRYNVDMPICDLCYKIVHEGKDPNEGLKELFMRNTVKEFRF